MQVVIGVSFASNWINYERGTSFLDRLQNEITQTNQCNARSLSIQLKIVLWPLQHNCYDTFCLLFVSLAFRRHTAEGMTERSEM